MDNVALSQSGTQPILSVVVAAWGETAVQECARAAYHRIDINVDAP